MSNLNLKSLSPNSEKMPNTARISRVLPHLIKRIAKTGALERYFRPEGKMNDSVVALPVTSSKLRLYCLRLSDKILVLGNGGVKTSQRYEDDTLLNGYVMTLQKFEKLLRQEFANGNVMITESTIETDNIFELS